ncbi:VapC toxin family PIN domain ribonuclease [Phyllobacterium brassicacearum]|uniref:VapC toxin family PIN domain ribonuclease n=1 Tax=Phyllobacterium brassicacearum TaxID=314235 RepID=A0A2P7BX36_9HYPH|nr:type II toxin-antitoxin system VapC family toxin [Phyllobacterium brassicacearum]PSH71006.1 VapC toxin family PIN domain ribonuclease [Phyllobacterium brassicacearum]
MFIDASAMVSMMTGESDARSLATRMETSPRRVTCPAAVWETAVSVARVLNLPIKEAAAAVQDFLALATIELVEIPPQAAFLALEAFDRYGKNRHPANLNFGDCFAYACARFYSMPLLYKGNDFLQTDIDAA